MAVYVYADTDESSLQWKDELLYHTKHTLHNGENPAAHKGM